MKKIYLQLKWIFAYTKSIIWFLIPNICISGILAGIGVYTAILSKSLIDSATSGNLDLVVKYLVFMGSLFLVDIVLSSILSLSSTYCSTKFQNQIQKDVFQHVIYAKWLEHHKYHSVNFLTRINNDVATITNLVTSTLVKVISLSITFITSFYTLIYLDATIAILSVLIAPIFLVISILFAKKLKVTYNEIQDQAIKYNSFIQEALQNIMIVKAFCTETKSLSLLDALQKRKLELNLKANSLNLRSSTALLFCSYLTYFIILSIGGIKLAKGLITFGSLTALFQLFNNIQEPLSELAYMVPGIIKSFASIERLMEIEDMNLEESIPSVLSIQSIPLTIHFDHVSFSYMDERPILSDITLEIHSGETVGLIGTSGSGKTTLIRLLLALATPTSGSILISAGHSTESIASIHRELISYVPQGNTLFSGTLKDNICYGYRNATLLEIEEACRLACAWDFIEQLDNQLDTVIGEKGIGLSEGQAQRIAIARAFLRIRPILILDEATSSLDMDTEMHILNGLKQLHQQPICIIITHRPSALSLCHRVYKLENHKLNQVD
ncbi:ABC transporter ATP-binding protein [Niameybacter massiliensis]|uniref:ABC transporter ATP-binding protein n=1 Tax=Holtiella tumoricola TaxID=3018743 RepID=A0AA42DM58_9FIRM|nr:ABC transporter ATP-binding protein [Holtiella tumoricola]MDA3731291.1 ABC transporter ATP-binding protein [Holtiella tumoricola]